VTATAVLGYFCHTAINTAAIVAQRVEYITCIMAYAILVSKQFSYTSQQPTISKSESDQTC